MNTRIKELRKILNLTQTEFGNKLGLKPSSISDIEHNRCNVTERLFISICSKFCVNENWLRTGHGDIFVKDDVKFNEFYDIYKNLSPALQDFLIQTALNLIKLQNDISP